jgi:hypothetical protein
LTIAAEGNALRVHPKERLANELRAEVLANKVAIMAELARGNKVKVVHVVAAGSPEADAAMEARRRRVLAILNVNPGFRYAVVTDSGAEPGAVAVQIGIRGVASGEIVIAKARYDGAELLRALETASTSSE